MQVLIPKFGLEGTVFLNDPGSKDDGPCIYNIEVRLLIHAFLLHVKQGFLFIMACFAGNYLCFFK